ncbi:hypothetical protein DBR40_05555 [Pedobacter sp. KBW01]|uniref:hypothetical protein n=2 Tax=unclassified Pedobacter TaxID=2628915 RepID=UPI000F5AFFCF|nr:hypothetical protein [Pedobacter sp. KBW01]RQO78726.1 hypothetical protein DBR40_05555 [Pedobacter sp. KBW01]
MKNYISKTKFIIAIGILCFAIASCQKKDYFNDGGISRQSDLEKNMSTYDFLASRQNHMFDSLVKIINLTNGKALVNQSNITFYACPNSAVMRFQRRFLPSDKQAPRPLSKIGVDTLTMLLKRFILVNDQVSLDRAVSDKNKAYKDYNTDSLIIYGVSGITNPGSSVRTSADYMIYEHRKIKLKDSINYTAGMQTHNLVTANAILHVLGDGANFGGGLKLKYFRINDN